MGGPPKLLKCSDRVLGFRSSVLGYSVWGLGFWVEGLGGEDSGFGIECLRSLKPKPVGLSISRREFLSKGSWIGVLTGLGFRA